MFNCSSWGCIGWEVTLQLARCTSATLWVVPGLAATCWVSAASVTTLSLPESVLCCTGNTCPWVHGGQAGVLFSSCGS
jgi:hypothetical protein